ncbi:MAG TPA: hypothetical protein VLK82_16650, partial [Candidatus Tectomicrobia bacterium]|nr:hypothetical protein [Candidatus Tectomicrobia bacterium]
MEADEGGFAGLGAAGGTGVDQISSALWKSASIAEWPINSGRVSTTCQSTATIARRCPAVQH